MSPPQSHKSHISHLTSHSDRLQPSAYRKFGLETRDIKHFDWSSIFDPVIDLIFIFILILSTLIRSSPFQSQHYSLNNLSSAIAHLLRSTAARLPAEYEIMMIPK